MTPTPLPPSPCGEREGARAKRGGRVRGTVLPLSPCYPLDISVADVVYYPTAGAIAGAGAEER